MIDHQIRHPWPVPPRTWTVTALGQGPRLRHLVDYGAAAWYDSEGWPGGEIAACGMKTMTCTDKFMAGVGTCKRCAELLP